MVVPDGLVVEKSAPSGALFFGSGGGIFTGDHGGLAVVGHNRSVTTQWSSLITILMQHDMRVAVFG
ncbi:hypothetical protein NCPPB3923_18735 [Burkholderia glumae]|nr:hypothetical protein NCPPB3923_18735 [Burkholderia glumae]